MKLWIAVFFLLPIVGLCYAAWRIWWLLPASVAVKTLAVVLLAAGFAGLIFYIRSGLDMCSRPVAIALYEAITAWPIVLLYLVMVFLALDLGRLCGLVPHDWMIHSMKGTIAIAAFLLAIMVYGNWLRQQTDTLRILRQSADRRSRQRRRPGCSGRSRWQAVHSAAGRLKTQRSGLYDARLQGICRPPCSNSGLRRLPFPCSRRSLAHNGRLRPLDRSRQ